MNPQAESCWLSTFFQSLWHSRVFHTVFDRLVRPLPFESGGPKTNALRETWELYEKAANNGRPVPVNALVSAWGQGYGDCAEAFGQMLHEHALQPVAEQFALVPVPYVGSTLPPSELWQIVQSMQMDGKPLLALELMLPPLSSAS